MGVMATTGDTRIGPPVHGREYRLSDVGGNREFAGRLLS